MITKAKKLRKLFEGDKLIRLVGAHNGLTAKLVERHGFEGVWASGFEISTSHAVPDANILTMKDYLEAAIDINDATTLPVVVDADTGYGNSNNVIRMVRKFEDAGIAAVCIEDKLFPKVNSFIPGRQELAPMAEFVGKIIAGKHAQKTDEFMIFARVEALVAGYGLREALKRAKAYMDAGADGIFIHSKSRKPDEIINFIKAWDNYGPIIISPTTYPSLTEEEMKELGISMVIYANYGIRAAIKAINETFEYISRNGIYGIEDKIAPMEEAFELQGMYALKENERKYLKSAVGDVTAIILAAGSSIDESLRHLLIDRPLAMLDINGKSILERVILTLTNSGINDINIVVGYRAESIDMEISGLKIIKNDEFDKKGIAHSIICGIKNMEKFGDKNLIIYSDILFDNTLINRLLKRDEDIILVVDKSFRLTKYRNKKLDLVITENPPSDVPRCLDVDYENKILQIGKNINEKDSHFEFIGISMFSKEGIRKFIDFYEKARKKFMRKPFYEAKSFEKASFTDLIQYMIDNGVVVSTMEVISGWTEVHTFDDYKRVCSILKNGL